MQPTINETTIIYEGLTTWQTFTVAAFTAAAMIFLQGVWDRIIDWWTDFRSKQVEDASDLIDTYIPPVPNISTIGREIGNRIEILHPEQEDEK